VTLSRPAGRTFSRYVGLVASEVAAPVLGRGVRTTLRYALGAAAGLVILLLLAGKRGELAAAWHQLGSVSPGWVAAAVGAESLSLLAFAWLQHRVLRLSGAPAAMAGLFLLALANDAISLTVPGEPAVSSAYRYRYYRRRGASGASSGWTIFTMIIAQAIGMALLLLLSVVVALAASTSDVGAGLTVLGLMIVIFAGAVLVRRDLVLRLAAAAIRVLQRFTGYPGGRVGARIEATLTRMREIPLSKPATAGVVAIAISVWCGDFLCLICSFRAVHAAIPWHGVLLAYGVAQVVGSFPVVPGGLGIVEGSLAVILVFYGAGRVPAVSATLAFRAVNFWLAIIIGWLSVAVIAQLARRERRLTDPQAPAELAGEADA
jgi:uncharacterized protein (TIRG00374 family)